MPQRHASFGARHGGAPAPGARPARARSLVFACLAALLLVGAAGCGDDGPGVAQLSADNVDDLGVAATEVATRAIALDAANFLAAASSGPSGPFAARATAVGAGDPILEYCEDGYITSSPDGRSIDFVACEFGPCQIDGRATASVGNGGDRVVIRLQSIVATCVGEPPIAFQGDKVICDGLMSGMPECHMDMGSFYARLSGRRLAVRDLLVEGSTVSARIRHPRHGTFWMTTDAPLQFDGCDGGVPMDGEITVWGGDDVARATISFVDCSTYEMCFVDAEGFMHDCWAGDWISRLLPWLPPDA